MSHGISWLVVVGIREPRRNEPRRSEPRRNEARRMSLFYIKLYTPNHQHTFSIHHICPFSMCDGNVVIVVVVVFNDVTVVVHVYRVVVVCSLLQTVVDVQQMQLRTYATKSMYTLVRYVCRCDPIQFWFFVDAIRSIFTAHQIHQMANRRKLFAMNKHVHIRR